MDNTSADEMLRKSIEAMRLATEEIARTLEHQYPNGLVAEIEDIKRRLSELERRDPVVPEHMKVPYGFF